MGLGSTVQWARGRQALKYEFEIIPVHVTDLPTTATHVLFAWERKNKLFVTEPEKITQATRSVFFKQYLHQEATVYIENGKPLPKVYTFKLQSAGKGDKADGDRKTIAKAKIDLAEFCSNEVNPRPTDVFLALQPSGKLKVTVRARWLKDAHVDPDALTEATELTEPSMTSKGKSQSRLSKSSKSEQDLSGFDHDPSGPSEGEDVPGSARRKARKERQRQRLEDEGHEPQQQSDEDGQNQRHTAEDGQPVGEGGHRSGRSKARLEEQQSAQQEEYIEEGIQVYKPGWKTHLCCCCFGSEPATAVQAHESAGLLNTNQAEAMALQNDTAAPAEQQRRRRKKKKRPPTQSVESIPEQDEEQGH